MLGLRRRPEPVAVAGISYAEWIGLREIDACHFGDFLRSLASPVEEWCRLWQDAPVDARVIGYNLKGPILEPRLSPAKLSPADLAWRAAQIADWESSRGIR